VAFRAERFFVEPDPVLVFTGGTGRTRLVVRNLGMATIYLGNEHVTSTDGFPIDPGESFRVSGVAGLEYLWAVTNASEEELAVFYG
jgi:hypothetical protein